MTEIKMTRKDLFDPDAPIVIGQAIPSERPPKRGHVSISVPAPAPDWLTANEIVYYIWCFLFGHGKYERALEILRAYSDHRQVWVYGLGFSPAYVAQIGNVAKALTPRFATFPWFEEWLHCRARDDKSVRIKASPIPPLSVHPFILHVESAYLTIEISAGADSTWQSILAEINRVGKEEWRQLQGTGKRNKPPVRPFLAALWLFWADFLGWSATKIADAHLDILSRRQGDTTTSTRRKYRNDDEYILQVDLFGKARYTPEGMIDWPRGRIPGNQVDLVRRYLTTSRRLLARSHIDLRPEATSKLSPIS